MCRRRHDIPGKPKGFVPFRDSVLTRLLRESFGGNCKTTLLCCCSPADADLTESLSTLRFGGRAKQVKNNASVNATVDVSALAGVNAKLTAELQKKLEESQAVLETTRTRMHESAARSLQLIFRLQMRHRGLNGQEASAQHRRTADSRTPNWRADGTIGSAVASTVNSSRHWRSLAIALSFLVVALLLPVGPLAEPRSPQARDSVVSTADATCVWNWAAGCVDTSGSGVACVLRPQLAQPLRCQPSRHQQPVDCHQYCKGTCAATAKKVLNKLADELASESACIGTSVVNCSAADDDRKKSRALTRAKLHNRAVLTARHRVGI